MDPSDGRQLRSRDTTERVCVRFINKTGRAIDIVWVNYIGRFVSYGILQPDEFKDINTYKTHPWIFIDRETGEKMRVGMGTVFHPRSCREISQRLGIPFRCEFRVPMHVFLPLFTLRRISLHAVMNCIRDLNRLGSLELPSGLISDIQQINQNKESVLGMYDVM